MYCTRSYFILLNTSACTCNVYGVVTEGHDLEPVCVTPSNTIHQVTEGNTQASKAFINRIFMFELIYGSAPVCTVK